MKTFFSQKFDTPEKTEEDLHVPSLRDDLEKTRKALEIAYAGFDNAVDADMIDCYIFEINALLKRYRHLSTLAETESPQYAELPSAPSPFRALVSHVLG